MAAMMEILAILIVISMDTLVVSAQALKDSETLGNTEEFMAEFQESFNDKNADLELVDEDFESLDFSPRNESIFEQASAPPKMSKRRFLAPERWR